MKTSRFKSLPIWLSVIVGLCHNFLGIVISEICTLNSGISLVGNWGEFESKSFFWIRLLVILVLILLYKNLFRKKGLILLIIGGLSNMIDSLFLGGVCDYFKFGSLSFNINDIIIWFGILLTAHELRQKDSYCR